MNLLTSSLPEGYQKVTIGEASLYALIGFLVVFAGIAFLIFIVWLVGKFMAKTNGSVKVKEKKVEPQKELERIPAPVQSEEIDEETVAVIMAALMAYYEKNNPKCEFTLKRIKRIRRNDYA